MQLSTLRNNKLKNNREMKKVLLTLAVFMSATSFAQVFEVASIKKVSLPKKSLVTVAGISPKGDYILLTDDKLVGLVKHDLTSGQNEVISTGLSAGYGPKISKDGKSILYREDQYVNRLRYSDVKQFNLTTGKKTSLIKATRNLQGLNFHGKTAAVVNNGAVLAKSSTGAVVSVSTPVVSINNRQLMITKGGVTSVLSPNGTQHSYIWPSVSPDGTKVCYYVCGVGCFVCDINGNNVKNLGVLRAAQWYDDNTVVGMQNKSDEYTVVESKIVAKTLDGKTQTLTDGSTVAMYPYASKDAKKIVYSTWDGEAYLINIK